MASGDGCEKKMLHADPSPVELDLSVFPDKERRAISKDLFIVEAALEANAGIGTLDQTFYNALASASEGKQLRNKIAWHDPVTDGIKILARE